MSVLYDMMQFNQMNIVPVKFHYMTIKAFFDVTSCWLSFCADLSCLLPLPPNVTTSFVKFMFPVFPAVSVRRSFSVHQKMFSWEDCTSLSLYAGALCFPGWHFCQGLSCLCLCGVVATHCELYSSTTQGHKSYGMKHHLGCLLILFTFRVHVKRWCVVHCSHVLCYLIKSCVHVPILLIGLPKSFCGYVGQFDFDVIPSSRKKIAFFFSLQVYPHVAVLWMRRRLVDTPFLKPDSSCLMPLNHFFHVARKLLAPGQQGSLMCYLLPSWLNLKCHIFARANFAPFPHGRRFPLFVVDLFCSAICCTVVRVLCCDWWWKPHLLKMCSHHTRNSEVLVIPKVANCIA